MKTLLKNATLINEGLTFKGSLLINGEFIEKIYPYRLPGTLDSESVHIIDAQGLLLLPGVIDDHVHFREPGLTHKGDLFTESRAAVAGGVTSYMEMPNTHPQTVTQDLLEEKYQRAADVSVANYSFYIGTTNDNLREVLKTDPQRVCGVKIFMGASTGNMRVDKEEVLAALFKNAPGLVAVHCEDEATIRKNSEQMRKKYGEVVPVSAHAQIRSAEACFLASSKAIRLATQYGTRLHILHLSTEKEMSLLTSGKPEDKRITAEVCVHHLWFDDRAYAEKGVRIKWNPSIKTVNDRLALWEALLSDKIDVIATDHAPHTLEEKEKPYFEAPSGGPLVQHSLVAMLELSNRGFISREKVVEKMCHAPARLFRIDRRGFLRENYFADLVLVDPSKSWAVKPENIRYKCGWSPFQGGGFSHTVTHTFVNGELVYATGEINEKVRGRRLKFDR
jgi:dihydroorotase